MDLSLCVILVFANTLFYYTNVPPHLFQLSLAESDIGKIGTIKVEGIINPTNAEIDLKDAVGKLTEIDLFRSTRAVKLNRQRACRSTDVESSISAMVHCYRCKCHEGFG